MSTPTSVVASSRSPWRWAALAVAALTLVPAAAMAQNGGGGGGGRRAGAGGAMAGMATAADMRQVVDDMDLSADKKDAIEGILQKLQADNRQAVQGLRDATPEERQQKMQDVIKTMSDAKTKVEAELTPDQKATFAKKLAGLTVTRSVAAVAAEKKAAAAVDVPADKKTQLSDLFDDTTKALDGYQTDADAVTDDTTGTAVSQKVQRKVQETNRQLVDILGQEDARTVVQAGRQAMRGNAGGAGGGGARRRRAAATTQA